MVVNNLLLFCNLYFAILFLPIMSGRYRNHFGKEHKKLHPCKRNVLMRSILKLVKLSHNPILYIFSEASNVSRTRKRKVSVPVQLDRSQKCLRSQSKYTCASIGDLFTRIIQNSGTKKQTTSSFYCPVVFHGLRLAKL